MKSKSVCSDQQHSRRSRYRLTLPHSSNSMKLTLWVIFCTLLFSLLGGYLWAQVIEGHETIEYSIVITYVGPRDSVRYDTEFMLDTMRAFPEIYCEGDFEFQTLIDDDKRIEVVCTYDWSPDGSGGH